MKKFLYVCLLSVVGTSMGYAITPPSTDPVKEGEEPKTEVVAPNAEIRSSSDEPLTAEEALYCKVTKGENTASCWFCNCAELAESME